MLLQGSVGPPSVTSLGVGVQPTIRLGQLGDVVVSELHGKYYEQVYRGNVYSGGTTIAALSANTITLSSGTTPILGLYNASTSLVNGVILQVNLTIVSNNFTSGASAGAIVWAASTGNGGVTTGNVGWNRKMLAASGSTLKYFKLSAADALTGITNNVVIAGGVPMPSVSALTYGTIVSTVVQPSFTMQWDVAGSIIVPPGGVWVIINTTSSTVWSVFGEVVWEEVPI